MQELAKKILFQIYQPETPENIEKVVEVLNADEVGMDTDICDVLGIPRRHNRAQIRKVLNENKNS